MVSFADFLEEGYSGNSALKCVGCGCENLHHYQVDVFQREAEDAVRGYHASVRHSGVHIDNDMKNNPSDRRDGLVVLFYCEQCDVISVMTMVQHKGTTYLQMHRGRIATAADLVAAASVL